MFGAVRRLAGAGVPARGPDRGGCEELLLRRRVERERECFGFVAPVGARGEGAVWERFPVRDGRGGVER